MGPTIGPIPSAPNLRQSNVGNASQFANPMDQYSFPGVRAPILPFQIPSQPNPTLSFQSNPPNFFQNKPGPFPPNNEPFNSNVNRSMEKTTYSLQDGRFGGFEQIPRPFVPQQAGFQNERKEQEPPIRERRLCSYFPSGQCRNGDNCPFIHDPNYQPKLNRTKKGGKH